MSDVYKKVTVEIAAVGMVRLEFTRDGEDSFQVELEPARAESLAQDILVALSGLRQNPAAP